MAEVLDAPLCRPPRPLRNPAGVRLPDGTCDAHFHVFAEQAPLTHPRSYTPQIETIEGWLALAYTFNIARGVLVQPSVYGLDNSVLLAALAAHPGRLRGVVVIADDTAAEEARRLNRLGVRGIRVNLRNKGGVGLDAVAALAPLVASLGWHVQFQVGPENIATVAGLARRHGLTAVVDHLAFMPLEGEQAGLSEMQRALDTGRVHVKVSAPYRLSDTPVQVGYRKAVAALAASHPERLLWGSDWPHTELFDVVPDDDDLTALALDALPRSIHHRVFVSNPEAIYFST